MLSSSTSASVTSLRSVNPYVGTALDARVAASHAATWMPRLDGAALLTSAADGHPAIGCSAFAFQARHPLPAACAPNSTYGAEMLASHALLTRFKRPIWQAAVAASSRWYTCKRRERTPMPSSASSLVATRLPSLPAEHLSGSGCRDACGFAHRLWSSYSAARPPSAAQHRCRRASAELLWLCITTTG